MNAPANINTVRQKLAAYYRSIGMFQSADNVDRFNMPLTERHWRDLEALK